MDKDTCCKAHQRKKVEKVLVKCYVPEFIDFDIEHLGYNFPEISYKTLTN